MLVRSTFPEKLIKMKAKLFNGGHENNGCIEEDTFVYISQLALSLKFIKAGNKNVIGGC